MAFKVLIPQEISNGGKDYLIERGYEITVGTEQEIDRSIVGEYDAILLRTSIVNQEVLDAAKKLKVIGRYGVGLDNIDLPACKKKGVRVTYTPTANMVSVSEYTLLMILQTTKNTYATERLWRFGPHDFNTRNTHCGIELEDRVLGVIGMGNIGKLVARKAKNGLDMKVIGYDPYVKTSGVEGVEMVASLDELLSQSDILTLHIPLTSETKNLIGASELAKMKTTAFLICAARGGIVNEAALIAALKNKKLAGAALDVFEKEPNTYPNPLFDMENVIVSPHTAGMTIETSDRVGIHAAMGIDDVLHGREPKWPVPGR